MRTETSDATLPVLLVVDRDPGVQRAFHAAAEGLSYRLVFAANAEEAWRAVEADPPWLVVSDYVLDGMDGLSLLARVGERFPGTQRILHTSEPVHRPPTGLDIPVLDRPCPPEVLRDLLRSIEPLPDDLSLSR